jgi:hypothetical protein
MRTCFCAERIICAKPISSLGARFGSTRPTTVACGALTLAVLCVLLIAARSAQAQTETVLYTFTGGPNQLRFPVWPHLRR